ncbi:hypothetical protein [Pararhodobacter marinus]|uniref:Uncharacterized protein n=1 Tax=Pararhodobacter marinus TaxID=2184063 RepID=A0A2U2C4I3_9RHOB|nr:hypothetical protein [Pararhodobacter marinus]PWE26772.1 hypothetical protein C4N9_20250 [Pararhodobacter marinus]
MIIRVVILFLLFILAMGMIQKALRPKNRLGDGRPRAALDRLRCPTCKRVNLGTSSQPCERPDCGNLK